MKSGCCSKYPPSLGLCQAGDVAWANHSQKLEAALKGKWLLCWMHNIKILSRFTSRLNPEWINYEIRINPIILCSCVPGIRWCICKDSVSYGKWDHCLSHFIKSLSQALTARVRGWNEIKLQSLLFDWLPLCAHILALTCPEGMASTGNCDCWNGMQRSSAEGFQPLDVAASVAGLVAGGKPENITDLLNFLLQTPLAVLQLRLRAKSWNLPPCPPLVPLTSQALQYLSSLPFSAWILYSHLSWPKSGVLPSWLYFYIRDQAQFCHLPGFAVQPLYFKARLKLEQSSHFPLLFFKEPK